MENVTQRITPCLWFDTQAEEAANFYTSILMKKLDTAELQEAYDQ